MNRSERDRRLLLELYEDKLRRYGSWDTLLSPYFRSGESVKPTEREYPSLEYRTLRQYVHEYSDNAFAQSENQYANIFSEWPDLVEYLRKNVVWAGFSAFAWTTVRDHLKSDGWPSHDSEQRVHLTLAAFAVATIVDDERILRAAITEVPELKTEFGDLLSDTHSDADQSDDVVAQWNTLCETLQSLSKRAMGDPPTPDVLPEIKNIVDTLIAIERPVNERCVSRLFDSLLSRVNSFFGALESEPEFSWLRQTERAEVHSRWRDARQSLIIDQDKAREELGRLNDEVPPALTNVRQLAAKLRDAIEHHKSLFERSQPADSPLADRHHHQELVTSAQQRIISLQASERHAQVRVLSQLSPMGGGFDTDMPDSPPRPPDIPPRPNGPDSTPPVPIPDEPTKGDGTSGSERSDDTRTAPSIAPASQDDSKNSRRTSSSSEQPADIHGSSGPPSTTPAESQPVSDSQAEVAPRPTRYTEKLADALRKNPPELAYAVQLCRLLTQLNIDAYQPPAAILEAVMLSDRLMYPDGAIASALENATTRFPSLRSLADYDDESREVCVMLMISATLRPTLLAPLTGAHSVLSELRPTERLARLNELTQEIAITSRSIQNVRVDSTVIETATSQTAWQETQSTLSEEAAEWLRNAPYRTIKYAAATDVWKRWVSTDGPIGRMMQIVADGSGHSALVAKIRNQLTDKREFETLVRVTDRQTLGRRRGSEIQARALDRLRGHAKRAGDFADRYLQLLASRPSQSSPLTQTLTRLRSRVAHLAPLACGELKELISKSASALVSGAANTTIYAIERFQMLFDTPADIEPDPRELFASALFRYPAIAVSRDGFPDRDHRQSLETLVSSAPESLRSSVRYRLRAEDYVTSRRIIDWIEAHEEEETRDLNERWEEALSLETKKLRHEIDDTRTKLSVFLSRQHILDQERDELNADLVEMETAVSKVVLFDQIRLEIRRINERLDIAVGTRQKKTREALSDLRISTNSAEYTRISRLISAGQTVEANELIGQIRRDGTVLPESLGVPKREIFRDFYPEIFEAIEAAIGGLSNRVADLIIDEPEFGGVQLGTLPAERRTSARILLCTWYEMEHKRSLNGSTLQLARALFEEIGFVVEDIVAKRRGRSFAEAEMRTSSRAPCPIPDFGSLSDGRYRLVFLWDRATAEDILQHANDSPRTAATVLLYFGRLTKDQREAAARLARERLRSVLIVDESLLVFLCGERDLRARALFACAIPFTYAQPYFTTAGSVPPEMFYGRANEIRQIAHPNGPNFVYGGRQLGKTALLRAVERTEHRPQDERYAIWIDLKAEQVGYGRPPGAIWASIWYAVRKHCAVPDQIQEPNALKGRVEEFVKYLTEHFRRSDRQLLLLLDEADLFFEVDARTIGFDTEDRYRESIRLKRLMDDTGRSIKVVFAGLHNVLRTAEYPNHPLGHFGEAIEVGPLWRDAEALIRQPLLASGYRFENDNLVTRILAQTNYYPNLIQLYCAELIKSMCRRPLNGGPLYDISETLVDDTYGDQNLRQMIRQRFHWTLQLDLRYEVIAYTIAYECSLRDEVLSKGLEYREIDRLAREYWPDGFAEVEQFTDKFRSLLDEMVGLGVLRKNTDHRYTLRNPNILPLMGTTEEIEESLLRERKLAGQFNDSFRAHDPQGSDSPSRSPLECRQADDLRASKNGVSVLCGSSVSGYDSVLPFLQVREARGSCRVLEKLSDRTEFERELDKQIVRRREGTTIYAVSYKVPWDEHWVRTALERIQGLRSEGRFARVLFMADPECLFRLHAALAQLTSIDWVPLRPWRQDFVRQWMNDVGIFQVVAGTTDVEVTDKVMKNTGGWPALLTRLHHFVQSKGDLRLGIQLLDHEIRETSSRSRWLREFGVDDEERGVVLSTVAELVEEDGGQLREEDLDEVRSLVADDGVDADYVLRTLRWAEFLHYAIRTGDDSWRIDPVLARLLRATAEE